MAKKARSNSDAQFVRSNPPKQDFEMHFDFSNFLFTTIAILLVVAIISGFNPSILKKDGLRGEYPDLSFEEATNDFVSSVTEGLLSTFGVFNIIATTLRFTIDLLGEEYDLPESWSKDAISIYTQLKAIKDQMPILDRIRLDAAPLLFPDSAPSYLETMYEKYYSSGTGGDF